jgi:hypothetical protein
MRLLVAWSLNRRLVHTAVDDLESFMWLLSWALVHILKKYGSKDSVILKMGDVLSNKDPVKNAFKMTIVDRVWPHAAFGNLMRDWLTILRSAQDDIEELKSTFSTTMAGSLDRNIACGELELRCMGVYEKVLKSGFSHREEISRRYSGGRM